MIKENRFSSENAIFSFGGLALNKKDRDKVKLREVVHRQLRYWDFELVSGDLYFSKTGPWWLRQQASTGEGSYKRSHERCLYPLLCKCQPWSNKLLNAFPCTRSCHDLNFHRSPRNGICELSCDTFQSSHTSMYLKLMVMLIIKFFCLANPYPGK